MSHQHTHFQIFSFHSLTIYNCHQDTHLVPSLLAFLSELPRPSAIEMPFDSSSSMLQSTPHQAAPQARHRKFLPRLNTMKKPFGGCVCVCFFFSARRKCFMMVLLQSPLKKTAQVFFITLKQKYICPFLLDCNQSISVPSGKPQLNENPSFWRRNTCYMFKLTHFSLLACGSPLHNRIGFPLPTKNLISCIAMIHNKHQTRFQSPCNPNDFVSIAQLRRYVFWGALRHDPETHDFLWS